MDSKNVGVWAGGFIGSFLVVMAIMYFLYPYFNPEKQEELQMPSENMEEARFDPGQYGPEAVDSLNKKVVTLQQIVDSLKARETGYLAQIDSLESHIEQMNQEQTVAVNEENPQVETKNLEDVSRSLLNLDEESLTPIVNLLDNNQLVGLYNSASNMQRAKLLRSLKPDKAATILKEVM